MSKYNFNNCYRLYEGPRLDMPNLFATMANLFLTCVFYSPLIPIAIPIGMVGMICAYWVNKVTIHTLNLLAQSVETT